jgi:hypothetical protein
MTTRFTDGTQGSASQVETSFTELRTQGQSAISQLVSLREQSLLLFSNALSALNSKRVRSNRLANQSVALKFVVSDLQDINQTTTTATLRCDTNSVYLKERSAPTQATVQTVRFSASEGTIQALNVPQTGSSGNLGALYRVATSDGSAPVGTFDITLLSQVSTSLIIMDMMNTPSNATLVVSISPDGITYTPAITTTRNGYRISSWFNPQPVQYVRLVITPVLPDTLGGNVYTFGLTDLHIFAVQYHLRSDLYTNQLQISPQGASLQFITDNVPGLTFFLALGPNPALEVSPGDIVAIPGVTTITNQNSTINGSGLLNHTLPTNVYLPSLTIVDAASQISMNIAPNLSHTTTGITNQYITVDPSTGNMYLIVYNSMNDSGRTFNVSYSYGPSTVPVSLQVEMTTSNLNNTPIYQGAELINV